MKNPRLTQVLRREAWTRAKAELEFIAETYKHEDAEHYAKAKRLMKMFSDIIEIRILP